MIVLSRHSTFGEALDHLFDSAHDDTCVASVDGQWCVVRDREALAAYEREERHYATDDGYRDESEPV